MKKQLTISAFIALFFVQPAYAAQEMSVLFGLGEVVNIGDADRATMQALMQDALTNRGFEVQPVDFTGKNDSQLLSTLRGENSSHLVVLDAAQVSASMVIMVRHTTGKKFKSDSVRLSRVTDFRRAAGGLIDTVLGEETPIVDTVIQATQVDTPEPPPSDGFYIGMGVSTGSAISEVSGASMGFLGKARYEKQNTFIDSQLMLNWASNKTGGDTFALDWTVGSGYLFSQGPIAPFVSYGIGLSHLSVEEQIDQRLEESNLTKGTGISTYLGVGVEFLRTLPVRLIVDARVILPTFKLTNNSSDTRMWLPSVRSGLTLLF